MPPRTALTDELREVLPASPAWDAWLSASGELAPDFAALPSRPGLWPPHEGLRSRADWDGRRAELRAKAEHWLSGPLPAATEVEVERLEEREDERDVLLHAGGASIRASLLLPPPDRRDGPVPVLAASYAHAAWAPGAVARGFGVALFAAGAGLDDVRPSPGTTVAGRRAWAASRVLDWLAGEDAVDLARVVVAGHATDGKAAVLAAAFDARFAGVVSSSSGVLGAMPVRLCADRHFGEGVEALTRTSPDWWAPRLRFFAGREDRLPTDAHELLALVAPRPVLLGVAVHDSAESVPAATEVKRTLDDLGRFLGTPAPTVTLLLREGGHEAGSGAIGQYLDWCAATFAGGAPFAPGEPPAARPSSPAAAPPARDAAPGAEVLRTQTRAGLAVDVHVPVGLAHDEAAPVVLWCPPPCPPTGYVAGVEHATPIHALLARAGCAVVCWDPPGTGSRVHEAIRPADDEAPGVLDAALALDGVRPGPVFALGYAAGAETALRVAAAHGRVTGVAAVAPDAASLPPLLRAARGKDVLVVAPRWSTRAEPEALRATVAAAEGGGPARIELAEPADFRFGAPARAEVLAWVARAVARRVSPAG